MLEDNCAEGHSMTTKITELTPPHLRSYPYGCPAVFVTDDGRYFIIGKKVHGEHVGLQNRVMEGEELVEVSSELLEGALKNRHNAE